MTTPASPVHIDQEGDTTVVRFRDSLLLDVEEVNRIEQELGSLATGTVGMKLVVDLEGIRAISSRMLSAFVNVHNKIIEAQGKMALCNLHSNIEGVFRITKLDIVFPLLEDRAAAMAAVR